jgi:hypothetical protein
MPSGGACLLPLTYSMTSTSESITILSKTISFFFFLLLLPEEELYPSLKACLKFCITG